METPNMPSVTPGVWISLTTAVVGSAAAFGLPISSSQSHSLIELAGALSIAIPALEAWLRSSRLKYLATKTSSSGSSVTVTTSTEPKP